MKFHKHNKAQREFLEQQRASKIVQNETDRIKSVSARELFKADHPGLLSEEKPGDKK